MEDLIIIKRFLNRNEAEIAKGLLVENGIEAVVSADDAGGLRPHLSLDMGNVQLLVKKGDAEKAKQVLEKAV